MGRENPWGQSFQKWFKLDSVIIDNFIFRLHHQITFFFLFVGVLFIFGENYLDGKAIVCKNGNEYANRYCWLHGAGHVGEDLISRGERQCTMDQQDLGEDNPRLTAYYIWLPFILIVCMGMAKLPRALWKNFLEGNLMTNLLHSSDGQVKHPEKIGHSYRNSKDLFTSYTLWYAICEILNIMVAALSMVIFDMVLHGNFKSYGSQYLSYLSGEESVDPLCNAFPTEVSCNVKTGGAAGGTDLGNTICILSNNLFNQFYFLLLWFWWVLLLTLSAVGLVYRLCVLLIPSRNMIFKLVNSMPVCERAVMTCSEQFVLSRMARNLKREDMAEVLDEIFRSEKNRDKNEDEEKDKLINQVV